MKYPQRWPSLADMYQELVRKQDWMSLSEAAELYRVTPETMRSWARRRMFGGHYAHGEWWLAREQLQGALRRMPQKMHP